MPINAKTTTTEPTTIKPLTRRSTHNSTSTTPAWCPGLWRGQCLLGHRQTPPRGRPVSSPTRHLRPPAAGLLQGNLVPTPFHCLVILTNRPIGRQKMRIGGQTDRQADRRTDKTEKQISRNAKSVEGIGGSTGKETDRQTDRQSDRHTKTDRQLGRQTRDKERHTKRWTDMF